MSLKKYKQKRNFFETPEPRGKKNLRKNHLFVIQKHAASHLHYDFRIELNGVLLSWAVPKGPCLDPGVKRLAMHVEDHPVDYGSFEGIIPQGQYGGGVVMLWDQGIWEPLDEDPQKAYQDGHLHFILHAKKLQGQWDLFRFKGDNHWFLVKHKDEFCKPLNEYDITLVEPNSVKSKASLSELEKGKGALRKSNPKKKATAELELFSDIQVTDFPVNVKPQLATLVDKAPEGEEWLHEIKFDGYRILASIQNKKVSLTSRNQNDWTAQFPSVVQALKQMNAVDLLFDGEVVVLDDEGKSNFQRLQNSIKSGTEVEFVYYIFDLLYYKKYDLRHLPLLKRKELLAQILANTSQSTLRYSEHLFDPGNVVLKNACALHLEGIVSKIKNSPYQMKRTFNWVKSKCQHRQEVLIVGYTPPQGQRIGFGALCLAVYAEKKLIYVGNVGTGFTQATLNDLYIKLQSLEINECPLPNKIKGLGKVTWVKPKLVAEIEFSQWTDEGHMRHPSFKGLRTDKKPFQVIMEKETRIPNHGEPMQSSNRKTTVHLTHPEKVLYPQDGITKADLLNYYESVSHYMLPFIKNRVLSLVRCPNTIESCFFQRHFSHSMPKELKSIEVDAEKKEEPYIYLNNAAGLLSLVQMGVLEIHSWGSTLKNLDKPDYIVFDLDPDEGLPWKQVVDAAFHIRELLKSMSLRSFVKTTGGKGLHVLIPFKPHYKWEQIKAFSHSFVSALTANRPDLYIDTMSKSKRKNKIFIDYLRNQKGSTAIAAFSTRARAHATVSMPLDWAELSDNQNDTNFNIHSAITRLNSLKSDPWKDFWTVKQALKLEKYMF